MNLGNMISLNTVSSGFRWEDGNNLTSNLFILIASLTTHTNTSDICSYKPYTEKKNNEKKY